MESQVAPVQKSASVQSSPSEHLRASQPKGSPAIFEPPNTPDRRYGIRTLKQCAETSLREYVRLLGLQRVGVDPSNERVNVEMPGDAEDDLDERIIVQADIALDNLRALECEVSNLLGDAQSRRSWRWLYAAIIGLLVPLADGLLLQFLTPKPGHAGSMLILKWSKTILNNAKYVTRNANSKLESLCLKSFGTMGFCTWQRLVIFGQNETQVALNNSMNHAQDCALNSTSNSTLNSTLNSSLNSTLNFTSRMTMLDRVGSTANSTFAMLSSLFNYSNFSITSRFKSSISSTSKHGIEPPYAPLLLQDPEPESRNNRILELCETYNSQISMAFLLLALLYIVASEARLYAAKKISRRLRMVYGSVESRGEDDEDGLPRQDVLKELTTWQWNIFLWGI